MKPFDLKKALAGEPVITRDGNEARVFVRIDDEVGANKYPVYGAIKENKIMSQDNLYQLIHEWFKRTH